MNDEIINDSWMTFHLKTFLLFRLYFKREAGRKGNVNRIKFWKAKNHD